MRNIDDEITYLAAQRNAETGEWRLGRRAIMKMVPSATEWKVRTIIREVRGSGKRASPAMTPEEREFTMREEQILNLPKIEVKVPKRAASKRKKDLTTTEQWVIGSDAHAPRHDERALEIFYQVIEEVNPSKVIFLGDLITLDSFSRFDVAPDNPTWVQDVAVAGQILGSIKLAAPDAELEWFKGNHEDRLRRYLVKNSPEFYGHLDISKLFTLVGNDGEIEGWKYIDEWEVFYEDLNLVLSHGSKVRKHSGASAMAHIMDDYLMSTVIGHCHRQGIYMKSSGRSRYLGEQPLFGLENGCLCEFDQDYNENKTTNWQQGFSVLTIDRSGSKPLIEPSLVAINQGKAVFRGT